MSEDPVPPEKLAEKLAEIANAHRALLDRASLLSIDDPRLKVLHDLAVAAIEAGRPDEAEAYFAEAEAEELRAAAHLNEAREKRLTTAAELRAERGMAARISFRYLEAASHFRQAIELLPAKEDARKRFYRECLAGAYLHQGSERADNNALLEAIKIYRDLLAETAKDRDPFYCAMMQHDLGVALRILGERKATRLALRDSVTALRAALDGWERDVVPMFWAAAQTSLGHTLHALSWRRTNNAVLEEAVNAYRAALAEFKRDEAPFEWAEAQNGLGCALSHLGGQEKDTNQLKRQY